MRRSLGMLLGASLVLGSCGSEESDLGRPPQILQELCNEIGEDTYDCEDQPFDIEGFVDVHRLPVAELVYIVPSTDLYATAESVAVDLPAGQSLPDTFQDDLVERAPIVLRISDAVVRKVMRAGNGIMIATWHLEVADIGQLRFFDVDEDGTEEEMVP